MKLSTVMAAGIATLALAGASTVAHAQTAPQARQQAVTRAAPVASPAQSVAAEAPRWAPRSPTRVLQWNADGRWGLRLDMTPARNRETEWKDVEAGVSYSVTPSLRVGASASVGDARQDRRAAPEEQSAPRVRFETRFRF